MSILDFLGNLPVIQALKGTSISPPPKEEENPMVMELLQNISRGDPYPHVSPAEQPTPSTERETLGNIPFYPDQMPREDPVKEALSQAVARRQKELETVPLSKIQQMALERVRPPKMTNANAEPVDPNKIINEEYKQWLLSKTPEAKHTAAAVEEVKSQLGDKTPVQVQPISTKEKTSTTAPTPATLPERKEEVPGFPVMPEVKRTSISGELEKLAEGLPKSMEELAGERPMGQRRSILGNIVAGAGMGLAGYDPYKMEQNAQARRDELYSQKLNFAKERAGKVHELKLKALDYKIKEEERVQEEQDQAIAKMGEMNPELAKNPNYMNRLFRGLPQEVRDKLIADSVDPLTGTFKKGTALYYDPMRKERLRTVAAANFLKDLGYEGTKDQVILWSVNPEKFAELVTNKERELKNRIYDLAKDQTPGARKEMDQALETLGRVNNWKPNLTDAQDYKQKLDVIKEEEAAARSYVDKKYKGNEVMRKQHNDLITQHYSQVKDIALRNLTGGQAGVADLYRQELVKKEGSKDQTPLAVTQDPIYPAAVAINPGIEAGYGKTNAPAMWNEFAALESIASTVPKGQDLSVALSKSMYGPAYQQAVTKWSQGLSGAGFGDVITEAATTWKGLTRIPFYNLAMAYSMAAKGEKNKATIRNILLAGIGTK